MRAIVASALRRTNSPSCWRRLMHKSGVQPSAGIDSRHNHAIVIPYSSAGRRRRFSEISTRQWSSDNDIMKKLERFTLHNLNSYQYPLGSLNDDQWADITYAISSWIHLQGGYSLCMADDLHLRLSVELKTWSPIRGSYLTKKALLSQLHEDILNAWLEVLQKHGSSQLALMRTEEVLRRLVLEQSNARDKSFPIDAASFLLSACKQLEGSLEATSIATRTLLLCLDHAPHDEVLSKSLTPFFNEAALRSLASSQQAELRNKLFERMKELQQLPYWSDLIIPDETNDIVSTESSYFVTTGLDDPIDKTEEGESENQELVKSSFEMDALTKRVIQSLDNAGKDDRETVDKLIPKIEGMSKSAHVVLALVKYFVRVGDAESASKWLGRIELDALLVRADGGGSLLDQVLESWSQSDLPKSPWRAEEILRQTLHQVKQQQKLDQVSVNTFNQVLKCWIKSNYPFRSQKVRDMFTQMVQMGIVPDAASLRFVLQAAIVERNDAAIQAIAGRILTQMDAYNKDDKRLLKEVLAAEQDPKIQSSLRKLLALFKGDPDLSPTPGAPYLSPTQGDGLDRANRTDTPEEIEAPSIGPNILEIVESSASAADIMKAISLYEDTNPDLHLSLYEDIIFRLVEVKENPSRELNSIFKHVLKRIASNPSSAADVDVSGFLLRVTGSLASRRMHVYAGHLVRKAEDVLLKKKPNNGEISVIPLECYKKLIVRKWYTKPVTVYVRATVTRLLGLYNRGYANLLPGSDIFGALIQAEVTNNFDPIEVESLFDGMLQLYHTTGREECKPSAKIFTAMILSYKQGQDAALAGDKALSLLNQMDDLKVIPETRTLSLAIQSIAKSGKEGCFQSAVDVFAKCSKHGLSPDSYSLHALLEVCGTASDLEKDDAVKFFVKTFVALRNGGNITNQVTYFTATKTLHQMLGPVRNTTKDKLVVPFFLNCCNDGYLYPATKKAFRRLMTRRAWNDHYTRRLVDGNEPPEWTANLNHQDKESTTT